jgi:hypothetical protein
MRNSIRALPQLTGGGGDAYCQAAAAARIVGKPDVSEVAESGDLELVKDHVWADAGRVHNANDK